MASSEVVSEPCDRKKPLGWREFGLRRTAALVFFFFFGLSIV